MSGISVQDALTGDFITFDYADGKALVSPAPEGRAPQTYDSIFYPGCSYINYGMPLVEKAYNALKERCFVQGISVLCCGKILSYEPNGENIRAVFEDQLRNRLAEKGIKRIVCACPNCVAALAESLPRDERTKDIELIALPQALADLGLRIDPSVAAELITGNAQESVLLCTHDSCPDREQGVFARGMRALMPDSLWIDPEHAYAHSICCGSLPRAAGNNQLADKCARTNGEEAQATQANAIVTACMSCAFQLNIAQKLVPAVNYLELLFGQRIDWERHAGLMQVRFLFDETLGVMAE